MAMDLAGALAGETTDSEASPWVLWSKDTGSTDDQKQLWIAHNYSIEKGCQIAAGFLDHETEEERQFIKIVLKILDKSQEMSEPTNSSKLGEITSKVYPNNYPISAIQLSELKSNLTSLTKDSR